MQPNRAREDQPHPPPLNPKSTADCLDLSTDQSCDHVREFPTSPHFRSVSIARQNPGAAGDALLSVKARMKDLSIAVVGLPHDFVSPDDEGLLAFINTLRLSVRARVAAEQQRGMPLSDIVVQVREMVRLAGEAAQHPKPFTSRAFRAISRQAVAWCVEAFRPLVFAAGNDLSPRPIAPDPLASRPALDRAGASDDDFPACSST
jgi:hypothetical protein